jgi:hypothetical protein
MRPLAAWAAERLSQTLMRRWRLNPSVLYRHIITAAMIVVAGVLALVMFDVFVRIGIGEREAFFVTLLVALSPPLLVFSILFFTELLSALLCLWLLRKATFDLGEAVWTWAVAGAATGFLVLIHIRNISIAMTLAAIALAVPGQRDARAKRIAFAASLGAMLAARTMIIHRLWGTWITTPIANVGESNGIRSVLTIAAGRLGGLLFDQEYGLLPYAPIFLVAVFGFVALVRTHPGLARRIGIVVTCYLISLILPITNAIGWTGGWSPAARFLVPIVPLLAIGVAAGVRTLPRVIVLPLVAVQVGINAYVWQHPKILWNNGTGQRRFAAVSVTRSARTCLHSLKYISRNRELSFPPRVPLLPTLSLV